METKEIKRRGIKTALVILGIVIAGIISAVILIWQNWHLPCPFREITGLLCPGCGATRMFLSILQFQFKEAFYYNQLFFITLPLILYLVGAMCYNYVLFGHVKLGKKSEKLAIVLVILFIIFGILRNII